MNCGPQGSGAKPLRPLTFILKTEWDKAKQSEQRLCLEKVDEACRTTCQVIFPSASEQLLIAYVKSVCLRTSTYQKLENPDPKCLM